MAGTQELAKELERYKKAYLSLDKTIRKELGPAIGLPRDLLPEMCDVCKGQACLYPKDCETDALTAFYTPEELVKIAAILLAERT